MSEESTYKNPQIFLEESGKKPAEPTLDANTAAQIVAEVIKPVMKTMGKILENNTAALEQLSATQTIQNDRLEALEKQIRLQTPVTSKQVTYLNDTIRYKARELLDKRGIDDKKATTKLGNVIRKAVLSRYGIGNLREVPKHEYDVAMSQIFMWNDALAVRDVVKEAKIRFDSEKEKEGCCK